MRGREKGGQKRRNPAPASSVWFLCDVAIRSFKAESHAGACYRASAEGRERTAALLPLCTLGGTRLRKRAGRHKEKAGPRGGRPHGGGCPARDRLLLTLFATS
jgi:hypothetical protein